MSGAHDLSGIVHNQTQYDMNMSDSVGLPLFLNNLQSEVKDMHLEQSSLVGAGDTFNTKGM